MKLIGLSGFRKSGCSFIADRLSILGQELGLQIKIFCFQTPLKEMYCKRFGVDALDLEHNYTKEMHRVGLQQFEDIYRAANPDEFCERLLLRAKYSDLIIVDDVRRLNEFSTVLYAGNEEAKAQKKPVGTVYKVHCDDTLRAKRGWVRGEADLHPSETEIASLSNDVFLSLGGGVIYNNKPEHLDEDLLRIIRTQFMSGYNI